MRIPKSVGEILDFLDREPVFARADRAALKKMVNHGQRVHTIKGEKIISEGDYDTALYIVLSGRFAIYVKNRETGSTTRLAIAEPGSLIGEMSIISGAPRSASVKCVDDSDALLIHREAFVEFLDSSPEVKRRVEANYRVRALEGSFKRLTVFHDLENAALAELVDRVEFLRLEKNGIIFSQGEPADSFFLIRDGFVRVSRRLADDESLYYDSRFDRKNSLGAGGGDENQREYIMAYLGIGSYFGEMAFLEKRTRSAQAMAASECELIRIWKSDFEKLLDSHPKVKKRLSDVAEKRHKDDKTVRNAASQEMLRWVEKSEILGGEDILVIDLNSCIRCLNCIETCSSLHDGVSRLTHNGIRLQNILIPTSCRKCREPVCMIGCPTGAIRRDKSGEVFHTKECIGCGNCAQRCPFGNISMAKVKRDGASYHLPAMFSMLIGGGSKAEDEGGKKRRGPKRKAVKCDLCMDYDYLGCQHNCPTGSILSVKPSEFFSRQAAETR